MIGVLLALSAGAQGLPGDPGYRAPSAAADAYRPAVDAHDTFATERPGIEPSLHARAELAWARDALRFVDEEGAVVSVLADAVALNLSAAWARGPVRIGATAPAWLLTTGEVHDGSAALLGDPTLDGKLRLLDDGPGGLALIGRLGTSLGADARQLGRSGPFGTLGAAAELRSGPVSLVLNAGFRAVPAVELGVDTLDDQVWVRAGGVWAATDALDTSLEVLAELPLGVPFDAQHQASSWLAGVHLRRPGGGVLHGGFGTALTQGVGAPAARLVVGVSWAGPPPPG